MASITSGIGLVSGINTGQLINELIQADSGPVNLVTQQNTNLTAQETAFQTISAQLLAVKSAADTLAQASTFQNNSVTSSNPSAVSGTAGTGSSPGTYNFTVSQLVTSQQSITKGFSDTNSTPVGAGTLTFESAAASLSTNTSLSQLNGGNGVNRGQIQITNRPGRPRRST